MPKPIVIVLGAIGGAVVIGGVITAIILTNSSKDAAAPSGNSNTSQQTQLVDPDGVYKLFSDASVTKHPEANAVFGNGQTLTFEYDGSKTANDEYATLSYQLYYIQDDGKVQPMGGGNLEGKGSGTFTVSDSVFNSSADKRNGFFELIGTHSTSASESGAISGSNVPLGMYAVVFEVDK